MDAWPVDRSHTGAVQWAEMTWSCPSALCNWNIWPARVLFDVEEPGDVARGEAVWRRPSRSARLRGLKLLSPSGEQIADARLIHYDKERIVLDFRPTAGPGRYCLYFGAAESPLFEPSDEWLRAAADASPVPAVARAIEARCALDSFFPMEVTALREEEEALLERHPREPYLVFPEDRDRPIKMHLEIPAHWAQAGPSSVLELDADRNEYRVFQLGIWACREAIGDLSVACSDLLSLEGETVIPAARVQCLTLESRIKSRFISKPEGPYPVPLGQVRALWFGIDIPEDVPAGEYRGAVTIRPVGAPAAEVPVRLRVSGAVVPDKGDHDLWRLSRLRWMESDVGLSEVVHLPFRPLRLSSDKRAIGTWGHILRLDSCGLPRALAIGEVEVLASPVILSGRAGGAELVWVDGACEITETAPARICWRGGARSGGLRLLVEGEMEYDGCAVITLGLESEAPGVVENLALVLAWRKEHAGLATGIGYNGRREEDRVWRKIERGAICFEPAIWMGSVEAGLGWATWETSPWEDVTRVDAITVDDEGEAVVVRVNLGDHRIEPGSPWRMQFALLPTPVKPPDERHWQFRYLHRGGGFSPTDEDTPQSYLRDDCRRLNELQELGVKRLNLHDWWGPAFNYPWQWEGPDNLSRLTAEAHKRGIFVKVYNSGRELSNLAPEFWGLIVEGARYSFADADDPNPRLRFQDAWHESHLPDGLPQGWPRLHRDLGNEHSVPVSNATRNGNFYLESMRYMTRRFGTDGAYWDGADGNTLGHREMAKRLWTMFREVNPDATIDAHHGNGLETSPITDCVFCLPFIDSIWHGEGFRYDTMSPWTWLVEIAGLPFGTPSEMLSGDSFLARGMLFGIWPRMGWSAGTAQQQRLWAFFDRFEIQHATLRGWWAPPNGVTVDRADTYASAFCHPENGVLLVVASWHPALEAWMERTLDTSLHLDRNLLGLPSGPLRATDIITDEEVDITRPVLFPRHPEGRLIWVRGSEK